MPSKNEHKAANCWTMERVNANLNTLKDIKNPQQYELEETNSLNNGYELLK